MPVPFSSIPFQTSRVVEYFFKNNIFSQFHFVTTVSLSHLQLLFLAHFNVVKSDIRVVRDGINLSPGT